MIDYLTKPFSLASSRPGSARSCASSPEAAGDDPRGGDIELDLITPPGPAPAASRYACRPPSSSCCLSAAQRGPRPVARTDPPRGMGVRLRPGHERRRRLCRIPAAQAAPRRSAGADRDGQVGRLPLRCAEPTRALRPPRRTARSRQPPGATDRLRRSVILSVAALLLRRLHRHRDRASQPDRSRPAGDTTQLERRCAPVRGRERRRSCAAARLRARRTPYAPPRRCCSCSCPGRAACQPSRDRSTRSRRTRARRRPAGVETRMRGRLLVPHLGIRDVSVPDVGAHPGPRAGQLRLGQHGRAIGAGEPLVSVTAARKTASRGRSCSPAR